MNPKITIINLTVSFLIIFFVARIWEAMSVNNYLFMDFFTNIPMMSLACLFFVNLGFAVFQSKQRMLHTIMSLVIIIMFFGFLPLSVDWHMKTQRRWFLQKGIQIYQPMADKIMQNKAMITHNGTPLNNLVGRDDVYGYTNADGSITITFMGRGNYRRASYMYYSENGPTNLFHLTNGWYEN
jgi:hypothetical protein